MAETSNHTEADAPKAANTATEKVEAKSFAIEGLSEDQLSQLRMFSLLAGRHLSATDSDPCFSRSNFIAAFEASEDAEAKAIAIQQLTGSMISVSKPSSLFRDVKFVYGQSGKLLRLKAPKCDKKPFVAKLHAPTTPPNSPKKKKAIADAASDSPPAQKADKASRSKRKNVDLFPFNGCLMVWHFSRCKAKPVISAILENSNCVCDVAYSFISSGELNLSKTVNAKVSCEDKCTVLAIPSCFLVEFSTSFTALLEVMGAEKVGIRTETSVEEDKSKTIGFAIYNRNLNKKLARESARYLRFVVVKDY